MVWFIQCEKQLGCLVTDSGLARTLFEAHNPKPHFTPVKMKKVCSLNILLVLPPNMWIEEKKIRNHMKIGIFANINDNIHNAEQ